MSNTKHTPTPWFVYPDNPNLICTARNEVVADTYGTDFDTSVDRANAAFIVRACNTHEELVAALKVITNDLAVQIEREGKDPAGDSRIQRARAALVAAEA